MGSGTQQAVTVFSISFNLLAGFYMGNRNLLMIDNIIALVLLRIHILEARFVSVLLSSAKEYLSAFSYFCLTFRL